MNYEEAMDLLVKKAKEVFKEKTPLYGDEYRDWDIEDVFNLLSTKIDKISVSINISDVMFEQDVIDALNYLVFLYQLKLGK